MKKQNYHAKLIIHDFPSMSDKNWTRLVKWLRDKAEEIENADQLDYSKRWTSRLMK